MTPSNTWNSDVLTTGARLCPYLDHSYMTAVQLLDFSNCPIWSMTERSKFLLLFSVVGALLGATSQHLWAPYCHHSNYGTVEMNDFIITVHVNISEHAIYGASSRGLLLA